MLQTLRFKKKEAEKIQKKWIEINKNLVESTGIPVSESEFVHKILELSIDYIKITKKGKIYIDV